MRGRFYEVQIYKGRIAIWCFTKHAQVFLYYCIGCNNKVLICRRHHGVWMVITVLHWSLDGGIRGDTNGVSGCCSAVILVSGYITLMPLRISLTLSPLVTAVVGISYDIYD